MGVPHAEQHRVLPRSTQQASRKYFSESLNSVAVMRYGVRTGFMTLYF